MTTEAMERETKEAWEHLIESVEFADSRSRNCVLVDVEHLRAVIKARAAQGEGE